MHGFDTRTRDDGHLTTIHADMHACIQAYMHVYIHVHMYVCMYVRMYVCVYVRILHVCMYVCLYSDCLYNSCVGCGMQALSCSTIWVFHSQVVSLEKPCPTTLSFYRLGQGHGSDATEYGFGCILYYTDNKDPPPLPLNKKQLMIKIPM